jgi:hypothetical protein
MKNRNIFRVSFVMALAFAFACPLLPRSAHAQNISQTAMAGSYSVNLKVLPAEAFRGPHAAMARDGGAEPNFLHGPAHPNHHLVAFLKKDGKPVEHARVEISYRSLASSSGGWTALPVVRMHIVGKGLATTHFGNNVTLAPGGYEARVTVNGEGPATFRFTL